MQAASLTLLLENVVIREEGVQILLCMEDGVSHVRNVEVGKQAYQCIGVVSEPSQRALLSVFGRHRTER